MDLAIQAQLEKMSTIIPEEYWRFASIFSEEESRQFPPSHPWDHAITLRPDTPDRLNCKVYPMTQEENIVLDKFINDQLLKGYIELSKSPYASSFSFIKKKDRKLRPVQDS